MQMPKRIKFRKQQRGKLKGQATRGNYVSFGDFGLQALEHHWVSARQLEAGRVAAQHFLHRQGKVYIRVFPQKSVSKKPAETRMGTGKGEPEFWAAVVKPGTVIYELIGCSEDVAKLTFNHVAHKLPVKVRFVRRRHV